MLSYANVIDEIFRILIELKKMKFCLMFFDAYNFHAYEMLNAID